MKWLASAETDEDLIAARGFIAADNEDSALDFLDAAFDSFDRLAQFPEMGPRARFQPKALRGVRFFVLPPPFNRWLIFYRPTREVWRLNAFSMGMLIGGRSQNGFFSRAVWRLKKALSFSHIGFICLLASEF